MKEPRRLFRCELAECGSQRVARWGKAIYGTCKACGTGLMRLVPPPNVIEPAKLCGRVWQGGGFDMCQLDAGHPGPHSSYRGAESAGTGAGTELAGDLTRPGTDRG